tara:strand:- start:19 stop:441 length:423 start_codon:yes stop_codon:yes gene_type:complete
MSVEKRVFNQLFKESKTELSTQKIELNLNSDFDKILNDSKNIKSILIKSDAIAQSASKMFEKANKEAIDVKKIYLSSKKEIEKLEKDLNRSFNELFKKSKELGVDIKKVPAYLAFDKAGDLLKDAFKDNQKIFNLVSQYL